MITIEMSLRAEKFASGKPALVKTWKISKESQFSPLSSTRRGVAYHKKKWYFFS